MLGNNKKNNPIRAHNTPYQGWSKLKILFCEKRKIFILKSAKNEKKHQKSEKHFFPDLFSFIFAKKCVFCEKRKKTLNKKRKRDSRISSIHPCTTPHAPVEDDDDDYSDDDAEDSLRRRLPPTCGCRCPEWCARCALYDWHWSLACAKTGPEGEWIR